jgi:predicted TIM-barrel fold metal-dependent hydrolase
MDRYTVISSDCHAGADLADYRPYLEGRWHGEFDRWLDGYENPFRDLTAPDANRNWDNGVRQAALEADGIVGEVIYPNTVPPFFPMSGLVTPTPPAADYQLRLAGIRAHNRWLAEWCSEVPGRRAGIGQILLNDAVEAVRDVNWIADHNLMGGALLPGVPPGSGIDPVHSPAYDPVWRACEERGVVVNVHGGGGLPNEGYFPATLALFVLEAGFFSHRPVWSLVMGGVFDRFPDLRLVVAEAGSKWIPDTLKAMDEIQAKQDEGSIGALTFIDPFHLGRRPSEYWATNCWVGASFMNREDAVDRHLIGVDRIMWGSDFPHEEGTYPFTREALANTYSGMDADEVAKMVGGNAAHVYGFNLDRLDRIAAEIGPEVGMVAQPINRLPDSESRAFVPRSATLS